MASKSSYSFTSGGATAPLLLQGPSAFHSQPAGFSLPESTASRSKQQQKAWVRRRAPCAALTAGAYGGALRWRVNPLDLSIRKQFESIDGDGKGHITEADLHAYAEAQGMPTAYVRPFFEALLARPAGGGSEPGSGSGEGAAGGGGGEGAAGGGGEEVGFRRFRSFVVAREQGLRDAFEMFDKDRDGVISPEDLDLSLQHVAICCPNTRCVLRCRQAVVSDLVARIGTDGSKAVSFDQFREYFSLLPQNDASMVVEYWLGASSSGSCADTGARVIVQEGARRGSPWGHLFAGAVAGAVSRTATAPLETLRLAAMAGGLPAGARLDAMATALVSEHGWQALYKGNTINVMRSAPQKALDFFAFDLYKSFLAPNQPSPGGGGGGAPPPAPGLQQTFLAAGLAGATSCLLLYPLDVARLRMTLDTAGQYRGLGHCLTTVVRREGAGALLRGLGPSLAAIFPEAAITYGLHDLLKRGYRRLRHRDPGIGASLAAGVASASMGQLVAYPLETISRRMQLGALPPSAAAAAAPRIAGAAASLGGAAAAAAGGQQGMGAWQIAAHIVREGGVRGLYAGVGAATLRLVPMAVVSFGVYELMRALLVEAEARWDRHVAELQFRELHGQSSSSGSSNSSAATLGSSRQQQQQQQQQQERQAGPGDRGEQPPLRQRWWQPPLRQGAGAAPQPVFAGSMVACGGGCNSSGVAAAPPEAAAVAEPGGGAVDGGPPSPRRRQRLGPPAPGGCCAGSSGSGGDSAAAGLPSSLSRTVSGSKACDSEHPPPGGRASAAV